MSYVRDYSSRTVRHYTHTHTYSESHEDTAVHYTPSWPETAAIFGSTMALVSAGYLPLDWTGGLVERFLLGQTIYTHITATSRVSVSYKI